MTQNPTRTATFLLRQPRQVQGYREVLVASQGLSDGSKLGDGSKLDGGGLGDPALTMIWIPPGRFWMGSPAAESERADDEGPQHLVQLQGFFMGQTPITQAQWRKVAGWQPRGGERWRRDLKANPSRFQSAGGRGEARLLDDEASTDQRPVEQVSWFDAMEFCSRLSQRTGRTYALPSEAQWEYACRAGTNTPFHFGKTITTDLANYDGSFTYANGPKGKYRQQTMPVGSFPANAWGLQDMHGNVREWCLDHWRGSYKNVPIDGSAWLNKNDEEMNPRLLRGGSWFNHPLYCRSAFRNSYHPADLDGYVGFRVCCLPPGLPSRPLNP
jgi:formylglycine-generating enzyme required for sulfatase activity